LEETHFDIHESFLGINVQKRENGIEDILDSLHGDVFTRVDVVFIDRLEPSDIVVRMRNHTDCDLVVCDYDKGAFEVGEGFFFANVGNVVSKDGNEGDKDES